MRKIRIDSRRGSSSTWIPPSFPRNWLGCKKFKNPFDRHQHKRKAAPVNAHASNFEIPCLRFYEYRKPTFPDEWEQFQEIYEYHKILRLWVKIKSTKGNSENTKNTNKGYTFHAYIWYFCVILRQQRGKIWLKSKNKHLSFLILILGEKVCPN